MTLSKPYRSVPIRECGEALVAIPPGLFVLMEPHPYVALGAPYGATSPWMLRQSVLDALQKAQSALQHHKPGWKLMIFDAYRPNEVQAYMVERELKSMAAEAGLDPATLDPGARDTLLEKVYRLFAIPSEDPATPPPHSTGAALDCTLIDATGQEVDMGSPIDENSDRSYPDHFASAADDSGRQAHANRLLLKHIMEAQGLRQNPGEWWHFSRGDQLAVWVDRDTNPGGVAIYGLANV